jgi:hypothetical protein
MAMPVLESSATATAAASSVAVPEPSGTTSTDFVAILALSIGSSAQTHSLPASFTQVGAVYQRNIGGGSHIGLSWWVSNADVSGDGSWTLTPSGGTVGQSGGTSYRVSGSSGHDATAGRGLIDSFVLNGNTAAMPSITTSEDDALALGFIAGTSLSSHPATWTLQDSGSSTWRYFKEMASAGATGTDTATVSAQSIYARGTLAFLPDEDTGETLELPAISDADTLHAPTVVPGAVGATLPLITNADSLHAMSVAPTYGLALPSISDLDTLYGPTVVPGAVTLLLPALSDPDTLHVPTVAAGSVGLVLPSISDPDTLYALTVVQNLALPSIADGDSLHAPVVSPGSVELSLPLISDSDTLYALSLPAGDVLLLPHISDTDGLFAPTVAPGAVGLSLPFLSDPDTLHAPSVRYVVALPAISDADTLHAQTVTVGAVTLVLPKISAQTVLYAVAVSGGITAVLELPLIPGHNGILPPQFVGLVRAGATFLSTRTRPPVDRGVGEGTFLSRLTGR